MLVLMRSVFSALVVATLILLFAVHVIAPGVPLVVGRAAVTDERTLRWEHARLLLVVNRNGSVRVTATEEGEVSLRAVARIYERSPRDGDEARAYAEQLLSTTQDGEWTTVRSEPEERPDNLEVRTDLELRVPPEVPLVLQVENGNVSAGPGVGPLTIQGLNADVSVERAIGTLVVETLNGRIRVDDAAAGADLTTVNGRIYAGVSGGDLEARTTNGAIVAHVRASEVGRCALRNENGGVTVTLPDGEGLRLDVSTDHGAIRCDYPLSGQDLVSTRQRMAGAVGDGRLELVVRALNGNVWIARSLDSAPSGGGWR